MNKELKEITMSKIRYMLGLFVIAMFGLAACSGTATTVAPSLEEPSDGEPAEEPQEEVTIEFWQVEQGREADDTARQLIIDGFTSANPNVTVDVVKYPWAGAQDKVFTAAATGTGPDVLLVWVDWMDALRQLDFMIPVTDVVSELGEDNYAPFKPFAYQDGEWWCLPHQSISYVLYYRTDIFEEAGLEPPRTWSQLLDAAEKLTVDTDGDGTIDQYGLLEAIDKDLAVFRFGALFGTNDADAFDADLNPILDVGENGERVLEILDFQQQLSQYNMPGATTMSDTDMRNEFTAGRGAMMLGSSTSYVYNVLTQNPELLPKLAAVPTPYNDQNPNAASRSIPGEYYQCVTSNSENPDVAKDFVKYWHTADNYLAWGQNAIQGQFPLAKEVIENDAYWDNERIEPIAHIIRDPVESIFQDGAFRLGFMNGPNPHMATLIGRGLWADMMFRLVEDGDAPEDVLSWAQTEAEKMIAEG